MTKHAFILAPLVVVMAAAASAQDADVIEREELKRAVAAGFFVGREADVLELQPMVASAGVRHAPFAAEAVTEFTQVLGDGNRIERSYSSSIARDSQGRTRREQEIAMVGPLASLKADDARLVVLSDPATGTEWVLDVLTRTARRNNTVVQLKGKILSAAGTKAVLRAPGADALEKFEQLGTRQIEGVAAEGTRTTMTIPAGAVGNVAPINVVTERWFSKDLQMDVLISRRDPRSGDTVYRLTNIVRAEPPPDLFAVPAGYTVVAQPRKLWPVRQVDKLTEKAVEKRK